MKPQVQYALVHKSGIAAVVACTFILLTAPLPGQTGGNYELTWSTIDGGGGTSSGGQYSLTGTIGQPDAAYSAGGDYELLGGFWPGGPLCIVDFEQFSLFADSWLDSGPDLAADLDASGTVDLEDLKMFVYEWLWNCPYNWPLK